MSEISLSGGKPEDEEGPAAVDEGDADLADVFTLQVPEPPAADGDPALDVAGAPADGRTHEEPEVPPSLAYILGPDDAEDEGLPSGEEAAAAAPPETASSVPVISIGTSGADAPSNVDVISVSKRRFHLARLGMKGVAALAVLGGLFLLGGVGVSYAAYDVGRDYDGKIMPGATIAGIDVGGLTRDAALEAVSGAIRPQLEREITLRWGDQRWKVTPQKLGARDDSVAAVEAALAVSEGAGFFERARMRILGDEIAFERDVALEYPEKSVRSFVQGLASSVDRKAKDATIDYDSGWVKLRRELVGREVRVKKTFKSLMGALERGASTVPLAVSVEMPDKTTKDFDQILLLRNGENKLYLYQRGKITHTWTVAPGLPSYPTPSGLFEVTEKRYLPTWVNPAPTTWGASMPASIPPGPGNPLGLRALNWSAPAIRFHGTSATYSLGYNASHGCVRMSNEDVIELYDLVDVGTPIVSVVVSPLRPLYAAAPDPIVVAEDAGEEAPATDADEPERAGEGRSGNRAGGEG